VSESLRLLRKVGDRRGEAQALRDLGHLAARKGLLDEAEALFRRALAVSREVKNVADEARAPRPWRAPRPRS
jgi:uncharacterized protein HemY